MTSRMFTRMLLKVSILAVALELCFGTLSGCVNIVDAGEVQTTSTPGPTQGTPGAKPAPSPTTGTSRGDSRSSIYTGCLAKGTAPDTYMLVDLDKGPKSVGIVSSTTNLATHVGHKVQLTGTAVPAKDAEADNKIPKAPVYMKITAVKMISGTCG